MTHLLHMLAQQNPVDRFFLPQSASNLAKDVDWAWNFVLGVTSFFFAIIVVAMIIFLIKYRRRTPMDQTSEITHNTPLEIMWTGIPLVLVMVIFFIGFKGFINYDTPESDAVSVDVTAQQWFFTFKYANGSQDGNLYLEKAVPVVLNLRSEDVLHALYIPAFRVQRNAVPGRVTQVWCVPEVESPPNGFDLFCTQYCGQNHSTMGARVYVLDKAAYAAKLLELANPFTEKDKDGKVHWVPYAQVGAKLYKSEGCVSCHTIDGGHNTGPTWKGLWKSDVSFSVSNEPGYTLKATDSDAKWEAYIVESVLHPEVKIVSGFQNAMLQTYGAEFTGTPAKVEKLRALIEYIKSIGTDPKKYEAEHTPSPTANPELFIADEKHPNHPESLAAKSPPTSAPAH